MVLASRKETAGMMLWLLCSLLSEKCLAPSHTPSIAFRHLPPNSARFVYATEGALFISAQLSTDVVTALRNVWVLIKLQALVYDILLWWKVPESGARSVISTQTFRRALTTSVDSCAEIKSAPSVA